MRRRGCPLLVLVLASCCGTTSVIEPLPDWSGPPLRVHSLADGSLELELMAPTAGHAFELGHVQVVADRAAVHLVHRTPGEAIVAQVLTPLRVEVPAERLAPARQVSVWIETRAGHGPGARSAARLAFVFVR